MSSITQSEILKKKNVTMETSQFCNFYPKILTLRELINRITPIWTLNQNSLGAILDTPIINVFTKYGYNLTNRYCKKLRANCPPKKPKMAAVAIATVQKIHFFVKMYKFHQDTLTHQIWIL